MDQPGSCSCTLSDVWLAQLSAGQNGLSCVSRAGFSVSTTEECECCAAQEPISAYYDLCNATFPDALPPSIQLPFNHFAQCEPSMSAIEPKCSDTQHGFPTVTAAVLATTMQPNGTRTLFDQAGTMTAAPYGSTTAWHFLGLSGPAITATAVPYKAIKSGGSSSNNGGGNGGSSAGTSGGNGNNIKQSSGSMIRFDLESFGLTIAVSIWILIIGIQ